MKSTNPNIGEEVLKIKTDVLKLLYSFVTIVSATALCIYLYDLFVLRIEFSSPSKIISFITTVTMLLLTIIASRLINEKNYKVFLGILVFLFSFSIFLLGINTGPNSTVLNLLIITAILTITIVIGAKAGLIYFLASVLFTIIIVYLHQNLLLYYPESNVDNEWLDLIILLAFIWLIFNIAKIAYTQIQTYLSKLLIYSAHLQGFNTELNKMVKDRTNILQKNFSKRIESMYNTAMIGNIAKPLIHDILSPFSALEGTLQLIQEEGEYNQELINQAVDSTRQISNLIYESRELIRGKDLIVEFDIVKHIDRVLKILRNELNDANIEVDFENTNAYQIKGIVGLFERIIINLLVNAMEELKHKESNRKILIEIKPTDSNVWVEITDNGRGIAKEYINKIFKEDFSLKHTDYNLGLGLPFIKNTITKKFKGKVEILSEINSYTKFTLTFNLLEVLPQVR